MSDLLTQPLAPQRPLERFGHLEADVFCEGCGYNLHGQAVTRDERLGIMICRCPECGRYHPAGHGATAKSIWGARLAAAGLLFWVLVVLWAVFMIGLGFGALQVLHFDIFAYRKQVALDGREIMYLQGAPVYADTQQPVSRLVAVYSTTPPRDGDYWRHRWPDVLIFYALSLGLGLLAGMLLVVVAWHWRRRRYTLGMLLPFVSAAFVVSFVVMMDEMFQFIRPWAVSRVLYNASLQACFIGVGVLIGRPVARGLARVIIPPRPRQHLAFLWKIDGKPVPPAN
jgi:hypothetical protein